MPTKEDSGNMGTFPLGGTPPGKKRTQDDTMHEQTSAFAPLGSAPLGSPQELMEVRIRVAAGYYDHPAIFMAAAEKILEKGDIKPRG